MQNATAPDPGRPPGPKMTIRVYTVTHEGVVTEPRAPVSVPHDYVPPPEGLGTQLPPCDCPQHAKAGTAR
ncbi:hypothetical protein [Streptomyces sp. HUAS TT20]|uniref:hypothetical protein n=1 Tax=Streptomyces sp. HUAS TT20 TaxID=3447509 RepID=UPI0021DA8065|nr:hypothetical protein [Streptomyces sp. HUAS 15-9]UXY33036.1 hypothetical protein N8I87_42775 [Streptomyces sp. HUAS 15-9]